MSFQKLVAASIPIALLACAVACTSMAGLASVFSLAAGALTFSASIRRPNETRRYVSGAIAVIALLIAGYFNWGAFVLTGNPTVWPRNLPFPDKAVLAIHDSINHPSAMPFGNRKTLLVIGVATTLIMSVAGWNFGKCLRSAGTRPLIEAWDRSYYELLPVLAGSAAGLCVGLFAAMLVFSKQSPLPLLMTLLGTGGGALLGWRHSRAPLDHSNGKITLKSSNVADHSDEREPE